jgi:hypothetical protein
VKATVWRGCGKTLFVLTTAVMLSGALCPDCFAMGPDSTATLLWSFLYAGRIDMARDDDVFPWNDPEVFSHRNDRLVSMLSLRPHATFDLFLKGASGYRREEEEVQRSRFVLEQGHIGFDPLGGWIRGRLFLRERAYRSSHKLLLLVSNDAPFLDGRGQGLRLDVGDVSRGYKVEYTESLLRSEDLSTHGGLPVFTGGCDVFRMLTGSLFFGAGSSVGVTASEVRSIGLGDGVMIGTDINLALGGIRFMAELARTARGHWDDLFSNGQSFYLDWDRASPRSLSSIFSRNAAFSSEVHGLSARSTRLGYFHVVPGYRFYGDGFFNPQGEATGGLTESSITSWWRHARYDLGAGLEVVQRYGEAIGERIDLLRMTSRARLTGGFELRGNAVFAEGSRPSVLLSIIDENNSLRILATGRVDDAGSGNDLTFLAEGQLNLSSSWALRNVLYLYRSSKSYYSTELEFRPGKRFLLRAAIGSFRPFEEDIMMNRTLDIAPPAGERWLTIYTRVWFGTM